MRRIPGICVAFFLALAVALPLAAQQPVPAPVTPPLKDAHEEFLATADEVLKEVSELLALPVRAPLKKSLRSRDDIRAYLVKQFQEEKNEAKRYADQKVLEKFGLIPKDFPLDEFLIELLTEQVAGLYDPKGKEFFIADWLPLAEQRMVMAHELVHALQDQHFDVKPWLDAAKPDDDAQLARGSVLEGSALAAMFDHALRAQKLSVRDLPDLRPMIQRQMLSDLERSPQLARAPEHIRDSLLFPYLAGTAFTQAFLRARGGWADFTEVFKNPPVTSQQILHPELYLQGVRPEPVALPATERILPRDWKKLDENIAGEFGLHAALKQFLGEERASRLSPSWAGDRYAIYEHQKSKELLLLFRLRLADEAAAARFFGHYSEALELKYKERLRLFRRPNFFSFDSEEGGVFLRCLGEECFIAEGTTRRVYDQFERALGWPAAPRPAPAKSQTKVAATSLANVKVALAPLSGDRPVAQLQ